MSQLNIFDFAGGADSPRTDANTDDANSSGGRSHGDALPATPTRDELAERFLAAEIGSAEHEFCLNGLATKDVRRANADE